MGTRRTLYLSLVCSVFGYYLVLSKVAKEFVVEQHLKPAILAKIDENQFGAIPISSTTYTLIVCYTPGIEVQMPTAPPTELSYLTFGKPST